MIRRSLPLVEVLNLEICTLMWAQTKACKKNSFCLQFLMGVAIDRQPGHLKVVL